MKHHTLGHLSPIDSPVISPGHAERMRQYRHTGEPTATHKASNPKDVIGSGKAPLSLVPASLRAGAAMAFMEGALKYGRFNWRLAGVRASIYYDALNRHMDAWFNGEETDPGSGLPHLYKAAACIAILLDAVEIGKLVDDRAPYADMDSLYEELADEVIRLKTARQVSQEQHPEPTEPHQCVLADSPKPEPSRIYYSKELLRRNPPAGFELRMPSTGEVIARDREAYILAGGSMP